MIFINFSLAIIRWCTRAACGVMKSDLGGDIPGTGLCSPRLHHGLAACERSSRWARFANNLRRISS